MVSAGAQGATLKELQAAAAFTGVGSFQTMKGKKENFKIQDPKITQAVEELGHSLSESSGKAVNVRNLIFADNGIKINNLFHHAHAEKVDFGAASTAVEKINAAVYTASDKKISKFLSNIPANTQLMILNILTLKMAYENSMEDSKETFTGLDGTKSATTFVSAPNFPVHHYSAGDLSAIAIDLVLPKEAARGQLQYRLAIVVPPSDKFAEFGSQIMESFATVLKAQKDDMDVHFPKFKIESEIDGVQHLQELGVKLAFDQGKAQFRVISPKKPIYVTKVTQKVVFELTETGVDAAVATQATFASRGGGGDVFSANKPFYYAVYAGENPIFVGAYVKPPQ
jgi:serine protease inhibitor